MELIPAALRHNFREFCVSLPLRLIDDIFSSCGIQPGEIDPETLNRIRGERRTRVEEYYASLDWTSRNHAQRFLQVVSFVLVQEYTPETYKEKLREMYRNAGFYVDGDNISFAASGLNLGNARPNTVSNAVHLVEHGVPNLQRQEITISAVTRRDIIDTLCTYHLEGRLGLIEFLKMTWKNLDSMPSPVSRASLESDLAQHMIHFLDWEYNFLLYDCLRILKCDDETFTTFLASCIHPLVRTDKKQVTELLSFFNEALQQDGYEFQESSRLSGKPVYKVVPLKGGVNRNVKNLIFAADGPKPEIVLSDSVSNDIRIVRNEAFCLVYDKPIPDHGLLWKDLVEWWTELRKSSTTNREELEQDLYKRLLQSLRGSKPEQLLFRTYMKQFRREFGDALPALIPQVYLHYDPYTYNQLVGEKRLFRQRMDFLLLFSHHIRIVIEVDGQQHYSENNVPSPGLYAKMVSEDRKLKLAGYEIYRFGGYELQEEEIGKKVIVDFFRKLFERYGVKSEGQPTL